jgi:hypothetical protein
MSHAGMIQDIVAHEEKFHKDRGTKLPGIPKTPAAPHLYDRTPDYKLLDAHDAENFWTEIAWAGTRAHPKLCHNNRRTTAEACYTPYD